MISQNNTNEQYYRIEDMDDCSGGEELTIDCQVGC